MLKIQRLASEFIGTATLVLAVVGSGAMAVNLSNDGGVQLLINALSTVLVLGILISIFSAISGSHFNPVVTLVVLVKSKIEKVEALLFVLVQIAGALFGALLANVMFELPAVNVSTHTRGGFAIWLGEVIATCGLIFIIEYGASGTRGNLAPILIPAWIGGAYFFTSSTSFANPAVTIGRSISNTFSGIAPSSVGAFIAAQLLGASLGFALSVLFTRK
ncbi:unannotated protein [freshwater metagenome]|uniref:Unannotated protein n=1 Tax=freshwater metagenome TaxID=449393 RepID=A0A6J7XRX6_9ZZZZ|nr:antitoxin [Actinomycetota bacterium]